MSVLLPNGKQYYVTNAGLPLVSGKVFTYDTGTNNPRQTTSDAAGLVPNANPVILDARGEAIIFWSGAYRVVVQDSLGNTVIPAIDGISTNFLPTLSIVPVTDNALNLGSPTFSWANVYVGVNHAPVLDVASGNIGYYARTAAEIAAGVTPVNFSYVPGYVPRYGTDATAINNALLQSVQAGGALAKLAPTAYNIGANTITIPDGAVLDVSGAAITSTNITVVQFGSNTTLIGYDATVVSSGAAGTAFKKTNTGVPAAWSILGWPVCTPTVFGTVGSIGLDFTAAYKGTFEVNFEGYETNVTGGTAATTPQTYYNEFRSPRIRCTGGLTGMRLRNGCNATMIINPMINGANVGTTGININQGSAATVVGGYIEGFLANVNTRGLLLTDASNCTFLGTVFDQGADATANFAIGVTGASTQCNFYGCGFAGAWGSSGRIMSWAGTGVYNFIGGAPTNQVCLLGLTTFAGSYLNGEVRGGKLTTNDVASISAAAAAAYLATINNTGDGLGLLIQNNSALKITGRSALTANRVGGPGYCMDFQNNGASSGGIGFCAGTPEAQITAVQGTIFERTDGGAVTSVYIKESGVGNVGWVAK